MLTKEQKTFFEENGYLHIQNVIDLDHRQELLEAMDFLSKKYSETDSKKEFQIGLDKKFIVAEHKAFRDLIDHESSFGYILDIMGPCIQLCMSHALIRPAGNEFKGIIHSDGGQSMQSVQLKEGSRPLQMKIQYFLTDVGTEYAGNFIFKPGSHKIPFPQYTEKPNQAKDMKQLLVKAGDVAMFTNALWHGATRNDSGNDRKSVIYGYSQMFLRPYDYHIVPKEFLDMCTKRQKRLLGDVGIDKPQAHYYAPNNQLSVMEGVEDMLG